MASLSLAFDILAKDRASKVFNNVGDAADKAGKKGSKLGDVMKNAGKLIATGIGAAATAAGALGVASVRAASDAEQSMGAVESVFGKASAAVTKFSEDSADRLGLSQNAYRELASVVGSQLKNMGQSQDEAAVSSDKLISMGADLAATFGGSVSDAVGAVGSLLRGERDPIERYGIAIKDADIKARLAAEGNDKLTGAAKKTAEAQATLKLLTEQAGGSLGAFGRESDTLAGKQERLRAKFEDVKAKIGTALIPAVTALAGKVLDLIAGFEKGTGAGGDLRDAFEKIRAKIQENKPQIEAFLTALGEVAKFLAFTAIPAMIDFGAKAVNALITIRDAGYDVQKAILSMVGGMLSGFGTLFGALAKIPGPFQENFKAASVAINSAKTRVDALKTAIDVASRPKTAKVNAEIVGAERVRDLAKYIANVKSKTVTVKVDYQQVGSITSVPFKQRAKGGPVKAGQPYIVGEREPELFVPRQSGQILNQRQMASAGVSGAVADGALAAEVAALRASSERIEAALASLPRQYQLGMRAAGGV